MGEESSRAPLLDVGTGTALIPIELARRLSGWKILGVDLAKAMLELGQRNIARAGLDDQVRLELVDAKRLPYPDALFPVVLSNSIVHHIPEPVQAVREMRRVLQNGGVLFVRDLMRPETAAEVEGLVALYAASANAAQRQLFRQSLHAALTLSEVRGLLQSCSLPPEWAIATSDRHWTISGRA